jgi:hypothetical protein
MKPELRCAQCFPASGLQIIPVTSLTLLGFAGDANALAGVSQDGRTAALYRPVTGRGEGGGAVPGVRYLPPDWLQDLHPVQGLWPGRAHGSIPTSVSASQPLALSDRVPDRPAAQGTPQLGCPEDPRKIKHWRLGIALPAISTVHAVLDRHGLVTRGRRPNHYKAEGTGLSRPDHPNDLWCVDYKGEFVGPGEPRTDGASRAGPRYADPLPFL